MRSTIIATLEFTQKVYELPVHICRGLAGVAAHMHKVELCSHHISCYPVQVTTVTKCDQAKLLAQLVEGALRSK